MTMEIKAGAGSEDVNSGKLYCVKVKSLEEGTMIISDEVVETIGDCLDICLTLSAETVGLWWSGQIGVRTPVFDCIPIST